MESELGRIIDFFIVVDQLASGFKACSYVERGEGGKERYNSISLQLE